MLADTLTSIGLFQPFDGHITQRAATADAVRYVMTWGSNKPTAWLDGNSTISAGYYLPFDADFDVGSFGGLGHHLDWWLTNRPDWILYRCDRKSIAWVGGLPNNVPLDISNQSIVAYQMDRAVPYMRSHGYTSLTVDVLSLFNSNGGCGVWTKQHTVWVQKFSGESKDPKWLSAVMYWSAYVQWYLHKQTPQLPLVVNSPGWIAKGDPDEEALIDRLDGFQDEGGFTGWGNHFVNEHDFNGKVWWSEYIQAHGKAYLVSDLWQGDEPDPVQRDYAVATYLMGKEHQAAMVTAQYGNYGVEHYWPEFATPVGSPCAPMYRDQGVYWRKFAGALAIVNPTTSKAKVRLPRPALEYADLEGRKVKSPLQIDTNDGFVLLTAAGCS